jgi:hypothetical protein
MTPPPRRPVSLLVGRSAQGCSDMAGGLSLAFVVEHPDDQARARRQRGPGAVTWVGLGGLSGPSPAAGRAARLWPVRSAPQKQHDEHDDSDEDDGPNTDIHDGLFPSFESPGIPGGSRVGKLTGPGNGCREHLAPIRFSASDGGDQRNARLGPGGHFLKASLTFSPACFRSPFDSSARPSASRPSSLVT